METREEHYASMMQAVQRYAPSADLEEIQKAYEYADRKHKNQLRKSGEPYIIHPLAVAEIVAEIGLDTDAIVAALLHDCLEDTDASFDEISHMFGHVLYADKAACKRNSVWNLVPGAVVEQQRAKTRRRGEAQKTRPHMPAAKNDEQRLRLEDLNENAEPSRARCSARGREVVMQECVLSCVQLRQRIRLCTPFGRSAANGSERMPVRVDQHFAAGARDAAGCFRDGHNGVRHARALRVQLRL